jgi:thiamine transport system ATP-binding protein
MTEDELATRSQAEARTHRHPPVVTPAVDHVSLTVAPDEIVAVLGASGSGKSSLLRAIAGLEPLSSGQVWWDQHDVTTTPVHRRGFAVLFQDGQLFPHLTVANNVAYGLLKKLSRAERRRAVDDWLERVDLAGYGPRPVTALSGGQAQRVALARCLASQPRLVLLDEPLSALDRNLRDRLVSVVATSLRTSGTPALYVTHDHAEAFAIADRIAVLDRGQLRQVAPPEVLWHHPADRVVAEFLGFGPFLSPTQAALFGITLAPGQVLGIGPFGLVSSDSPTDLAAPVIAWHPSQGTNLVTVRLPDGTTANLHTSTPPGPELHLSLSPNNCVVVPDSPTLCYTSD